MNLISFRVELAGKVRRSRDDPLLRQRDSRGIYREAYCEESSRETALFYCEIMYSVFDGISTKFFLSKLIVIDDIWRTMAVVLKLPSWINFIDFERRCIFGNFNDFSTKVYVLYCSINFSWILLHFNISGFVRPNFILAVFTHYQRAICINRLIQIWSSSFEIGKGPKFTITRKRDWQS